MLTVLYNIKGRLCLVALASDNDFYVLENGLRIGTRSVKGLDAASWRWRGVSQGILKA